MCLIVTLSVTLPTPLKVNAVSDDTSKKLYVIGTIAAWAGIDIDLNEVVNRFPNFVNDVIDLAEDIYDELSEEYGWDTTSGHGGGGRHREPTIIEYADDLERHLNYLSNLLQPFNPAGIGVNYKFILCLVRAIARWCDSHIHTYTVPDGSSVGDVATVSGYVDFYTQKSFSFTFPTLSSSYSNTSVVFPLNNCEIRCTFNPTYALRSYYLDGVNDGSSDFVEDRYLVKVSPLDYDFSFVGMYSSGYISYFSDKTFDFWSANFSSLNYSCYLVSYPSYYLYIMSASSNSSVGYFASGDKRYTLSAFSDGYAFVNRYDNTDIYNNLTFASVFDAFIWFWDLCGINIRRGSPSLYGEVDTSPPPIVIDNTTYDNTVNNITNVVTNNSYQEGDTVTMVFPSYYTTNNYYNYDDFRQHPDYIFDFNQDGLLNSDFNMPSYDGNKLATKFPFCIPFDIYNLVSNLVVPPEAPQFRWLVLPADSFGLGNDDFYIDLDFTPYNFLVQLMRFFIAAGFLVWLMTKTKDLMQ